jgi:SM-20-related protein
MKFNELNWKRIGDVLSNEGFWIGTQAFSLTQVKSWRDTLRQLPAGAAGTGKQAVQGVFRTDKVAWLEHEPQSLLNTLDNIKNKLNETCFLGLQDFEAHYAFYDAGGHYAPHLDAFKQQNKRLISAVIYLNDSWLPESGGQLRIFDANGQPHDVQPEGGTLALFRSTDILHEVRPAHRTR